MLRPFHRFCRISINMPTRHGYHPRECQRGATQSNQDVKMETSEGGREGGQGNEGGSRQGGKLNVTSHI